MAGVEVAAAPHSPVAAIASALDPTRIDVWDVAAGRWIGGFDSALSMFGGRLTVADVRADVLVIAGSWGVPGIRAHDPRTGAVHWERRDLVRSGPIASSSAGPRVAVARAEGPTTVVDARHGSTLARDRGAGLIAWSPFRPVALVERTGRVELVDTATWAAYWRAPIDGFAVLAMAFGDDRALVAPAIDFDRRDSADLVCLDLAGRELWKARIAAGHSAPALAWMSERSEWMVWEFDVERRSDALVRLTRDGGIIDRRPIEGLGDAAFAGDGRWLVTSESEVFDTATFARRRLRR
jgi:hypothetical protein